MEERLMILRRRLSRYYEAEDAILSSQSYELDGIRLTRADLKQVQAMIAELERAVFREEESLSVRGRSRMRVVIPRDGMRVRAWPE